MAVDDLVEDAAEAPDITFQDERRTPRCHGGPGMDGILRMVDLHTSMVCHQMSSTFMICHEVSMAFIWE